MITRDNLKEVLKDLKDIEIQSEEDQPGDYFIIWVHVFNVGSYTTIEATEYNEEKEQEANDNGQLFIDKDQFFEILKETTGREF